jgi:hypothetical protein
MDIKLPDSQIRAPTCVRQCFSAYFHCYHKVGRWLVPMHALHLTGLILFPSTPPDWITCLAWGNCPSSLASKLEANPGIDAALAPTSHPHVVPKVPAGRGKREKA